MQLVFISNSCQIMEENRPLSKNYECTAIYFISVQNTRNVTMHIVG